MASAFTPWGPSTGPGSFYGFRPGFAQFSSQGFGTGPGYSFTSGLVPFPPAPPSPQAADVQGILLEGSWSDFIALETGLGGPASHLIQE